MINGYVVNEELRQLIQQVTLQHLNAFQPRPRKGRRQRRPTSSKAPNQGDDFPRVKIVNKSGTGRVFGNVVGYGPPTDPPPATLGNALPTFESAAPTAGKPFAVLLADIAPNDTGDAGPVGVVAVQLDFKDATHEYADAITNDYAKLASAATGPARIIWREKAYISGAGSLGVQWARVRLDNGKNLQFAEVYTAISAMATWGTYGTGTVKFKNDNGTDETGTPVTVENRYKFQYGVGSTVLCDRSYNPPRVYADSGGGGGGSLLTCLLSGPISAGTAQQPIPGSGTVYKVNPDGSTEAIGSKVVFNPYKHRVAGNCTVSRIDDDHYLLAGFDILEALALLSGFTEKKSLAVPQGGTLPTDIQWLGGEC
jgi:hypothetical protein